MVAWANRYEFAAVKFVIVGILDMRIAGLLVVMKSMYRTLKKMINNKQLGVEWFAPPLYQLINFIKSNVLLIRLDFFVIILTFDFFLYIYFCLNIFNILCIHSINQVAALINQK